MKKLTTIIAAMAAVLLTGACNKAEVEHEGSAVTLDYTVSLAEAATKADIIGDGAKVDKMVYAIFNEGGDQVEKTIVDWTGNSFSFSPALYYGQTYTIALFAYKEGAYNVGNITGIARTKNGEAADAFSYTERIKITQDGKLSINGGTPVANTTRNVTLTRPVAQLVVATENFGDMTTAGASKIEVVLNAPASYNAMIGESSTATAANYTSAVSNLGTIEVSDKSYCVVSLNYLFPTDNQNVTIKVIKVNPDNTDTVIREITLGNVPLVANKKTQIYGNLVKGDIKFNVSINNVFNEEVTEIPVPVQK